MDPNATAAALAECRAELAAAKADGASPVKLRRIQRHIAEHVSDLRQWRASGGFAPRDGWPHGL